MKLRETPDGWYLAFRQGLVSMIQIDFRLGFYLLNEDRSYVKVQIGQPCTLRLASDQELLLVPEDTTTLVPVLSLFNTEVRRVEIRRNGQLSIDFGEGRGLRVPADPTYEAWELGGSALGFMLVCPPGGDLSLFRP